MTNERYLAGCILLEDSVIYGLNGIVSADDFEDSRCKAIFVAANEIKDEGGAVDPVSIRARASQHGVELPLDYLAQLLNITPSAANFAEYGRRVSEDAQKRRVKEIVSNAQEDMTSSAAELVANLQAELANIPNAGPLELICATDVEYSPPKWLIPPYFQRGKGTLIQADPGTGKTAFMCAIAASVTTGEPIMGMDVETPGSVLMLSVEDDLGVLRGRISANNGDPSKVYFMPNAASMTLNSPEIEQAIKQVNAKLLIFDPLQAFLGAKIDMFRANETRPALAKLFDMCERNDCACAIISHMGKSGTGKSPVNQSLGSVDIPAAMRSVLHIARNPEDNTECIAVHVKSSNAPKGRSIAYEIVDRGGVKWHGFCDFTVDDLNAVQKRTEKGIPYENEPLVQVFNQLITDRPGGGFWSYANLKAEGAKILGFPPFGTSDELKRLLSGSLARELQKRDGLIVTVGEQGAHNVRGVRIERYVVPNHYQTKLDVG